MPELPEVEAVRRGLRRARLRDPIVSVWRSDKPLRTGARWRVEGLDALPGARPGALRRRGKFLVWELDGADGRRLGLLVHLGMTGRLQVVPASAPAVEHTHLRVRLADDRELRFVDPRRFGGVRLEPLPSLLATPPLCELGPEPLSRGFDGATLSARAGRSRRALHDVLLDQRVLAGVGNIYAQEALFEAGLHPLSSATRLRDSAWDRLAAAVCSTLRQGIANGGTTIRDYRDASGRRGRNQAALWVYGRAGEPCRRCGATLQPYERSGRRGTFCPHDQPRPRTRRIS